MGKMWERGMIKGHMGEFLEGPRLELCAFTAIGPGSVPGQVTKTPKARLYGPKRKERKKKNIYIYMGTLCSLCSFFP